MKAGIFSIGLDTYWPQFEGLLNNLNSYHNEIHDRIVGMGIEMVDAGMVDSVEKAGDAASLFRKEEVEVIFLFISTYALSSTVLPVVQKANVPVVMLNLQPVAQLDYEKFNALGDRGKMTGVWLEHCQSCSVPELACVFNRAGIDYHVVSGYLQEEAAWTEIEDWVDASKVMTRMRENRVGVLGHYYCGMLDVYSDMTQQSAVFGNHFELLEMCELYDLRQAVTDTEIVAKIEEFREKYNVSEECEQTELERAAKTSVALDKLVAKHRLGSMAYYYEGSGEYENIVTSVIAGNTLLTGRNVPIAGECEIKNVQAMKIMDLFGVGGSFSEFYLSDFVDDVLYLGHDGPAHFAIAEGRVSLVPLPVYHGKPGKGLSIQMTVQHGPVTLLSVVQRGDGSVLLQVAEGESVEGPILQIGNTNSRYRFSIGAKGFMNDWSKGGPAHHCAIGVGHIASKVEKLGSLLGIEVNRVC
ncbi:L-fucose/L-arabinose isomerase family protein [Pelagicoccus mobilis]|uniref:L-fucose/L-arabinose isomerase family protein n=1 Tax=Pelagicoccus mobilis TaxID=415221 RepID=A0A934RQ44_9BACT|nr:L-fucose/L-arabinose isomerase family protein [Pelagicoccus mobilis]MBK1875440.1 L-fucose/L-arabinose isomerase family protein [Pelagicoccus mobilis]